MFELDFDKVIIWLLPRRVRTVFNVAYLKAVLTPLFDLYNEFQEYRADINYKLEHNSQVCYMEAALNDAFDFAERRIFLTESGGEQVTLINRDTDGEALIINDDANGGIIIHNDSAYFGGSYDFIVNIPYQFTEAEIYRLRAIVDYYKLPALRYDIIVNIR